VLNAQNKLYVKSGIGTQTAFTLSNIKKMTFAAGNLTVSKTDGNTAAYPLGIIRYLSFNDYTTDFQEIIRQESNENNLILYPNPVTEQLQISYETMNAGIVQVAIFDVQGKVLYQQNLSSQTGTNSAIIPVSKLIKGLYMFRMKNGNRFETLKFLKN
jgi:hypothetical protein